MRTVEEYLEYERLCRRMAAKLTRLDDKQALESMASVWARMAADRRIQLMRESPPKPDQR